MDEGNKQPSDYVAPQERVEDPRYRVAGKVVSALSKPSSVLLFVVVIVLIFGFADWAEFQDRIRATAAWMTVVEDHRFEEMKQCQSNLATIVDTCLRELGELEK